MNNAIIYPLSGRNWLPYDSIDLPPEAMAGNFIETWLRDKLRPMALPDGFLEKVIASARGAADYVPAGANQVRFLIFTAVSLPLAVQTWGFFRIVKDGDTLNSPPTGTFEIVFYLYAEGSAKLD